MLAQAVPLLWRPLLEHILHTLAVLSLPPPRLLLRSTLLCFLRGTPQLLGSHLGLQGVHTQVWANDTLVVAPWAGSQHLCCCWHWLSQPVNLTWWLFA